MNYKQKIYHGLPDGHSVEVIQGEKVYKLSLHAELVNHSPTGFSWGYGGSGPAQLALAILADATGNDAIAMVYHQKFKWDVIANMSMKQPFYITEHLVHSWLSEEKRY